MTNDEIIEEVWRNRDSYSEQHRHSLAEMVADLQARQKRPGCKLEDRRDLTTVSNRLRSSAAESATRRPGGWTD